MSILQYGSPYRQLLYQLLEISERGNQVLHTKAKEMKQPDYISNASKEKIGDTLIKYVLKKHPLISQVQLRRIFCNLYQRLRKTDKQFNEIKRKVIE